MKMLLKTSAAIALIAGLGAPAFAQSNTATGSGTVNIIAPIAIAADTGTALDFGVVAKAAGTVTVSATDGARGGSLPNVGGSTTRRQTFTVSGDASRAFTPTIGSLVFTGTDAPTVVLTNNGVTALGSNGSATLGVGGTLTIGANTPVGVYNGTFSVSVAYN